MASDPRRFDAITKVVSDQRRQLDDIQSTVLSRVSSHTHPYIPLSTVTAKGDLLVATASGVVATQPVGSNNQVLIADSSQSDGLRYGAAIPVVASTGSITGPFTDQVIINSTDRMLYLYDGSAWVAFLATGGNTAATTHESRYEQRTLQTLTTSTDTKLKFDSINTSCSDVTASGTGNTDFNLVRGGLWAITAAVRYVAGTAGERHIFIQTGTTFNAANRFASQTAVNVGTAPVTVTCSAVIRFAANTSICVGGWQNNGGNLNTDVGFGGTAHLSMAWIRP